MQLVSVIHIMYYHLISTVPRVERWAANALTGDLHLPSQLCTLGIVHKVSTDINPER